MDSANETGSSIWRTLARDIGILLALLVLTRLLFAQADARRPPFTMADIHVLSGAIASFDTVSVPERAAAPQINSTTYRARTAIRLEGRPPNILAYIPGSTWSVASEIAPGTHVRLEVTEDPIALAAQARAYPAATFLLAVHGLQIGDRVYFSASDTIARADNAVRFYTRLAWIATAATVVWVAWLVWAHGQSLHHVYQDLRR